MKQKTKRILWSALLATVAFGPAAGAVAGIAAARRSDQDNNDDHDYRDAR